MTIVYIDTEHDHVLGHPELGPVHRDRIETLRDRLSDIGGQPCAVRPYAAITLAHVERDVPSALVIGGNMTDWAAYEWANLAGLLATIRAAPVPILGICAGHQLIGYAHGAAWGPLGRLHPGEVDPDPGFAPGQRKEHGFLPVEVDPRCPLFHDLAPVAIMFQLHYWQLEESPAGFIARARSEWSPIQAIERQDRPVFGVQFHAERFDTVHPHGETVLRNFFALAQDSARP